MTKKLSILLAAAMASAAPSAPAEQMREELTDLLNARIGESPRAYESAARAVAAEAAAGRPLHQFVLGVVAAEPDSPPSAKLPDETRRQYVEKNKAKIRLAAQKENALAWYLLYLESGDRRLLQRAADNDNVQALNELASGVLEASKGWNPGDDRTQKTWKDCFAYFSRAAVKNDGNGLYNVGVCHLNGWGAKKDAALAFEHFKKAAERDQPKALNVLGEMHRDGKGVDKDAVAATKYFSRSAGLGYPKGQWNYAKALLAGDGIDRNDQRAVALCKSAAERGMVEAMDLYAKCLCDSVGVEPPATNGLSGAEFAAAMEPWLAAESNRVHEAVSIWNHCAVKKKHAPSMDNLATCFRDGRGVPADGRAAVAWYRLAADEGYVPAMEHLADCCEAGIGGLRKSHYNANWWRTRAAAASGDRNAWVWLGNHALEP